jgi:serine/threonine-protein kinase
MGEVYRARDTRLARTVALKVLHGRPDAAAHALEILEREARAVAALNHPNICTLYDVGQVGALGYLVMEHLDGQTLEDVLRAGPLASPTVMGYARQLAGALAAAHAKGIIHRDLKPANLFLTTDGTLKVLDFGIAKSIVPEGTPEDVTRRRTTQSGTFIGTVGYAAPEQLRGEPVDHRTDIFAVGAVLSELLTGRPPFARSSTVDTMSAILNEPPLPLPSTIAPSLQDAIARCLEKNPARRFQSALALSQALESTPSPTMAPPAPSPRVAAAPSIAVLPFSDLSPARDQEYFCDGMADELIGALMGLSGVRVASLTSSFQFKGRAEDVTEIGRRLKVNSVLEGSVRRSGDRLRISVRLTDVRDGFQLWSERFDRSIDDVFAVQDEIAHAIVDKLKVEMTGKTGQAIVPLATRNLDAYNLYLQGRYLVRKLTRDGLEKGMDAFRRAVELQPDYADAHAALAQGYILLAIFSVAPPRHVMPLGRAATERALAANPDFADGRLARAWVLHWYDWNWIEAEKEYRRAIELSPGDSWVSMNYSVFLAVRGRPDEAIREAMRAIELDPVSLIINRGLGDALYLAGRHDEAIDHASRALALEPTFFSTYWILGLAKAGKGQYAEAATTLEQGRQYSHGDAALEGFLGWAYGMSGDRNSARTIAHQLEARRETSYVTASQIGIVYQGLDEIDEAMRWYRQAFADRATDCCTYARAPHFEQARADARFRELIDLIEAGAPEANP